MNDEDVFVSEMGWALVRWRQKETENGLGCWVKKLTKTRDSFFMNCSSKGFFCCCCPMVIKLYIYSDMENVISYPRDPDRMIKMKVIDNFGYLILIKKSCSFLILIA